MHTMLIVRRAYSVLEYFNPIPFTRLIQLIPSFISDINEEVSLISSSKACIFKLNLTSMKLYTPRFPCQSAVTVQALPSIRATMSWIPTAECLLKQSL